MRNWLVAFVLFTAFEARANEFRGVLRNNAGVAKLHTKNSGQALEDFSGALADLPYSGEVHYNIANSFLMRREYEKSLSEYQQAIKNAPGDSRGERELRFLSHFNAAVALTELKKIDEALENYQKALELKPGSIETKTNIELLTSQQGGDGGDDKDQDSKDGKGKGQGDNDKDSKSDKDKDDKDKKDKLPDKVTNPRPSPRPFKSEELSQQDVKRILEELKRQEEQIRARLQNEQRKDMPPEKDW